MLPILPGVVEEAHEVNECPMMIGGKDTTIEVLDGPLFRSFLWWYCELIWPACFIVSGDTDKQEDFWFVYRDENAEKSWVVHGSTPENEPLMFSFIFHDGSLTVTESVSTSVADTLRTAYVVFADALSDIASLH